MRGIFKPERDRRMLEDSLDVSTILKDIADTGGDYPGQIISLLGIENIQLNEQEKQAGLKDWVLRMLVLAPPAEKRWSHFLRQPAKVDSTMQRTIHHEDAETVFG